MHSAGAPRAGSVPPLRLRGGTAGAEPHRSGSRQNTQQQDDQQQQRQHALPLALPLLTALMDVRAGLERASPDDMLQEQRNRARAGGWAPGHQPQPLALALDLLQDAV